MELAYHASCYHICQGNTKLKSEIQNRNNKRQVAKLENSKNTPKRVKNKNNTKNQEKKRHKHKTGR